MERFTVLKLLFILIAVIEVSSNISHYTRLPLKLSTHPKVVFIIIPIASQRIDLFYWEMLN